MSYFVIPRENVPRQLTQLESCDTRVGGTNAFVHFYLSNTVNIQDWTRRTYANGNQTVVPPSEAREGHNLPVNWYQLTLLLRLNYFGAIYMEKIVRHSNGKYLTVRVLQFYFPDNVNLQTLHLCTNACVQPVSNGSFERSETRRREKRAQFAVNWYLLTSL